MRTCLVCISLVFLAVSVAAVEPIPGDINLDGRVDFTDFIILAQNFNRSGPKPTPPEPEIIVVRDTITQIIQDEGIYRPEEMTWSEIFARERSNIYWLGVGVEEPGYQWIFVGTGFAVAGDAIITNVHVVTAMNERAENILSNLTPIFVAIPAGGNNQDAFRLLPLANDPKYLWSLWHPEYSDTFSPDVALMLVDLEKSGGLPGSCLLAPSLYSGELQVGQEIGTIGYPGEMNSYINPTDRPIPTSKTGTITALRPYNPSTYSEDIWGYIANRVIEYDFDITGGTSGSPVFNRRGEVVAVNNSGFAQGSLSYGIRVDEVRDLTRAIRLFYEANGDFDMDDFGPIVRSNLSKPTVPPP